MLRDDLKRVQKQPSLLVIEVAWRWIFGAVAIALLAFAFVRLQHAVIINPEEEAELQSMSPDMIGSALVMIGARALPVAARLAAVIVPALLVLWVVAASVGRAMILTRLVGQENVPLRWSGFIGIHALRAASVLGLFAGYLAASFSAALFVNPENPNYLLSAVVFLVIFLIVLALWIWVHWVLSLAAIFPVSRGMGTVAALKTALQFMRQRRGELAFIATGNGTARSLVALVFTFFGLLPLALYSVAPGMLLAMEILIALAYCVLSDWFLLARLVGYTEAAIAPAQLPTPSGGVQHR